MEGKRFDRAIPCGHVMSALAVLQDGELVPLWQFRCGTV